MAVCHTPTDIQSEPTFVTKRVRQKKRPYARKSILGAFQRGSTAGSDGTADSECVCVRWEYCSSAPPVEPQLPVHKRSREETYSIPEEPSTTLPPGEG